MFANNECISISTNHKFSSCDSAFDMTCNPRAAEARILIPHFDVKTIYNTFVLWEVDSLWYKNQLELTCKIAIA